MTRDSQKAPGLAAFARSHAPMLAVLAAFAAFSAATLGDFGLTWDEGVKMFDDAHYADALRRIEPYDPRVLHIPGYFYVVDTLRSLYAKALSDLLPDADPVLVHHSFNALLATACLALLYALVLRVSGARRLALWSAIALVLMPQFVGHSQNNPKDLPAVVLFLWAAQLAVAASSRPRWRTAVAASFVYGVALTTRVSEVLLAPILGAWLLLRRREVWRRQWRGFALGLAGAGLAAVACWPALWFRGAQVFALAAERFAVLRGLGVKLLYLGKLYPWTNVPWHYTAVQLLATLPPLHLAGLLALPVAALRWRARDREKADALWLGVLWVGLLLGADLLAPLHYDGVRHLLTALPGLALLAACGADAGLDAIERAVSRQPAWLRGALRWAPALLAALTIVELAPMHPYETAYLNPIARVLAGGPPEQWLEVEYWGSPYKEGAAWIDSHAEPDAVVHVPIGGGQRPGEDLAKYYLTRPVLGGGSFAQFQDTRTPRYLMIITRVAWYNDFVRSVRAHYAPVYTVKRQGATLLEIYANRSGRRP
jgi:4-amino-4-deoxy-L-arabinose transferase-like glycosyltransferase